MIAPHCPDSAVSSLYSSVLRLVSDPRPRCVVPVTPGLSRRPTWLALIVFFFSAPMSHIWAKLSAGFFIGIAADTYTNRIPDTIARLISGC